MWRPCGPDHGGPPHGTGERMRGMGMVVLAAAVAALGCAGREGGATDPTAPGLVAAQDGAGLELVYGLAPLAGSSCRGEAYDGFDFWLGDWSITTPSGSPAGGSRITREAGGCVVLELYQGGSGRSLSRYDRAGATWHQDYVDATGFTLRLFGGVTGGAMVMQDSVRAIPNGPALASRFAWTPNGDGTVRQLWEFSVDGGASFFINFDGSYARQAGYVPPAAPAPGSCATRPAQRAADGFLGTWRVATASGRPLGTSTLSLTTGTCLIEELFQGAGGYTLRSFLYYDRFVGTWYRAQADNRATGARLGGGFAGSTLQLTGQLPPADSSGTPRLVRLLWTPDGPNALRQRWEVQQDSTWRELAALRWTRLQ